MSGPWDDELEDASFQKEKGEYCESCRRAERWMDLIKCPMCTKHICDKCRYPMGGKHFCGSHCANEFFFGGEEDDA